MYISRRTGGGRGVYEIAGRADNDLSPADIQGCELVIQLDPYVQIQTGLQLNIQGKKPRLVIKQRDTPQRVVQIQRQIAAILLLPKPIRADSGLGNNDYVIQKNEYVVERLDFQRSFLKEPLFEFVPNNVELKNKLQSITFNFLARFARVVTLWQSQNTFPNNISELLAEHRQSILAGTSITTSTEKIVEDLYKECAIYAKSAGVKHYIEGSDLFLLLDTISPTYATPVSDEEPLPEEIDSSTIHYEGAKRQITVNAYERNASARKQCVAYYGYNCSVCKMNFESFYGTIGQKFIHVHHLQPLSELQDRYQVDPIKDLRPVCPNCHAMLHKRKPPFTIDELQKVMSEVATRHSS